MEKALNSSRPDVVNYRQMLRETREQAKDSLNRTCPHLMQEDIRPLAGVIAKTTVNFIAFDNGDLKPMQRLSSCAKLDFDTRKCSDGSKTYLSCASKNGCKDYISIQDCLPAIFDVAKEQCITHLVEEWLERLPV